MSFQGIRRVAGEPVAPCTCCGYSGHGRKLTACGWCDEEAGAVTREGWRIARKSAGWRLTFAGELVASADRPGALIDLAAELTPSE